MWDIPTDPSELYLYLLEIEWLHPFYAYVVFIILTFAVTDGARRCAAQVLGDSKMLKFNEFLSVLTMCTAHFGEASIYYAYGLIPMFIAIIINWKIGEHFYRGSGENSCLLFEEYISRTVENSDMLALALLQYFGATLAYIFNIIAWHYTAKYTGLMGGPEECLYLETAPLPLVALYQFLAAAGLRVALEYMTSERCKKYICLVYATLFCLGQHLVGVPGVHPMMCASRLTGCYFLQEDAVVKYICVYLLGITTGWLVSAAALSERTKLKSMWRVKFEKRLAAEEAALMAEQPVKRFVGKGNRRREVR
ncbi:hypothetical protein CRE_12097 [Caenorhabditis remanei]|uniref:Uncharacterized protein n=1 Tax=Caenorhabditis remanei TaxID=31234 RepID=E3MPW2_CAERE|nr:hypothetical protein CRE_12097 [Caenorhabditis remanei]